MIRNPRRPAAGSAQQLPHGSIAASATSQASRASSRVDLLSDLGGVDEVLALEGDRGYSAALQGGAQIP